jgi:hypothetical protein
VGQLFLRVIVRNFPEKLPLTKVSQGYSPVLLSLLEKTTEGFAAIGSFLLSYTSPVSEIPVSYNSPFCPKPVSYSFTFGGKSVSYSFTVYEIR